MACRFPVDTPEFEALAAAYRDAKTDEEAEAARARLGAYAAPYIAVFRLKGAHAPKQGQPPHFVRRYSKYRVAMSKLLAEAMEENR